MNAATDNGQRTTDSKQLTTDHGPCCAPAWFRFGVIAAAVLLMCSCRSSSGPKYRVATPNGAVIRGQSPDAVGSAPSSAVAPAAAHLPRIFAPRRMDQAACLPDGSPAAPCAEAGCACCDYGPIRGPSDEYLCDGGDHGLPAAVLKDRTLAGLEQEDAVAHYDTVDGRTVITPSNKVCIYAPRFAAVRKVVDLRAYARYDAAGGTTQQLAPVRINESEEVTTTAALLEPGIHRERQPSSLLRERNQAGELDRDRRAAAIIGVLAPYANLEIVRTGQYVGQDRVELARSSLNAITWTSNQAAQVVFDNRRAQAEVSVQTPGTIYHLLTPNNPRLRLVKLASRGEALPGEEVEFTLRFDNVGDRVIGNVTIVDNLTTRLQYVADSQKSSLKANFSTRPNDGDSLVLRWEIREPVQPGQGGVLQFRARVR
ncbi:MAG: DUF11 domain-containing protein [Pirellulales bacterium]|nr:DUF11 domain-containing protein [Pirellulales bacterium]